MVLLKIAIVLLIILFGLPLIQPDNLDPFIPENTGTFGEFGWSGILRAAGVIFFAYIGFDAVSVAAQEARNPQRDLPIGILGSLGVCTVLYVLMALTLVGLAPYQTLNVPNPATIAVRAVGPELDWLARLVNVGAVVAFSTVILVSLYGQSRIFYSMARDKMLPWFDKIDPRFGTPARGTIIIGVLSAVLGGLFPLDILGELVAMGTLLAFVLVSIGVIVLRYTKPNAKRPFVTPLSPIVPLLAVAFCGLMMYGLPEDTWVRLAVWFIIGLVIYALYGVRHAKQQMVWTLEDAPTK
jgi:APA family basic amino acid/polyamine antiporter